MTLKPSQSNSCRFEGCTLTGALSVTTHVRDAVTVIHGPKGCTHHNFSLLHATSLDNDAMSMPNLISTGLSETDVVFGGENALDRTLDSIARTNPPAIFVLSTCIVDTIGDDVAMVCSKERGMPVVLVPTAGFLGGTFPAGVNNALVAVAGLALPCEKTVDKNNHGGVNIIGEKNLEYEVDENYAEVKRLLAGCDLTVNCRFVHDICTDDIAHLGAAQLNILRDPALVPVGEFLQERFGTPYIPSFPVGMTGTLSFLQNVGVACGVDYDKAMAHELAFQHETLATFRDLAGASVPCDSCLMDMNGVHAVHEVADALHLTLATGTNRAALPLTSPIGSSGVRRMLHRWRRAIHA